MIKFNIDIVNQYSVIPDKGRYDKVYSTFVEAKEWLVLNRNKLVFGNYKVVLTENNDVFS